MEKHFVTFLSPGTMVAESSTREIPSWDIERAVNMARGIKERHGATPYGFQFSTRRREDDELDSRVIKKSGIYFLGGRIETLEEVEARKDPQDEILISNMKCNKYDKIITNDNSWRWTMPFGKDDVLLRTTWEK